MTLTLLIPPAIEPVDLAYAKTFLRVDHDHEDGVISDMIAAGRERVEAMTGHALISRRVKRSWPVDAARVLTLTPKPVLDVHALRVVSQSGDVITVPSAAYTVETRSGITRICLSDGRNWQGFSSDLASDLTRQIVSVEAEYSCGFGELISDVPHAFRQAILMLTAQSYEYRDHGVKPPTPMMVEAVLMPYMGARL